MNAFPRSLGRSIPQVFEDQWLYESRPEASLIRTTLTQSYIKGANSSAASHQKAILEEVVCRAMGYSIASRLPGAYTLYTHTHQHCQQVAVTASQFR